MKPVMQTDLTSENGNCFSACLASMLELPIEQVPTFRTDDHGDWWDHVQEWLGYWGFYGIDVTLDTQPIPLMALPAGLVVILSGRSFTHPGLKHSIIARVLRSDKHPDIIRWDYLHDPNPSGKMIDGLPEHITFIAPLEIRK